MEILFQVKTQLFWDVYMKFAGVYTAIVTPFQNGHIDYDAYNKLIEEQIEGGVAGIVPCGTTGESPTLSHSEHQEFIAKTVEIVNGRIKVIAGTGSNSTEEAIHLTKDAEHSGADAALLVSPYYNKPTQEGLYQHFQQIAANTGMDCILYNIPGRTAIGLEPDTIFRLSDIENIRAIKEASGNLNLVSHITSKCQDKLTVLSGDDSLTLPIISVGGKGVISVLANLLPQKMTQLVKTALNGQLAEATKKHTELFALMQAMFLETNPIPIKAALSFLGKIQNELRLPLTPLSSQYQQQLKELVQKIN